MHISKISFLWLIGHKRITWSFFFFFNHSLSSKLVIKMIKCILGSIFIINITSIGGFSVDFSSLFRCDWCDGVWFRKEKGWCGWRPCRVLTSIDKCSFVAASPLTSPSLSSCFLRSFIILHTLVSISIPILSETPIKKPNVFWLSLRSTPSNPSFCDENPSINPHKTTPSFLGSTQKLRFSPSIRHRSHPSPIR